MPVADEDVSASSINPSFVARILGTGCKACQRNSGFSRASSKHLAGVAAAAIFEIQVPTKRAPAIMTRCARVVADRKMFKCARRTDLTLLRQASNSVVTVGTSHSLARAVLGVTEGIAKGKRIGRSSSVWFLIVAHAARSDVAAISLRVRRVTTVTTVVSGQPDGDREGRASS
jgi:hypothetical protein